MKGEFYHKPERVYDYVPACYFRMVMWDLTAQIGKEEVRHGKIGAHTLHNGTNDNGQQIQTLSQARMW